MESDTSQIIVEAQAQEIEEAKRAGKFGYMARTLVQASLPHSRPTGNEFSRTNGRFSLSVLAPSKIGLPYGSIPRLLLSWVTTEAFLTQSPALELGPTLGGFMAELGLGRTGGAKGDITRFKNQARRLFASTISWSYEDEGHTIDEGFRITKHSELWWDPKQPEQPSFWKSKIVLTEDFFRDIIKSPVPVDMQALKALRRSPMALDIYFWLTYRMSYLRQPKVIKWPRLQTQFGADYANNNQGARDFKKFFILRLKKVLEIYDKARVGVMDNGVLLKPSPTHIPMKRVLSLSKSKEPPPLPLEAVQPVQPIPLRTRTFEKAREIATGLDVYAIESEWREWMAEKGKTPKDPDRAFLGFYKKKAKQHGFI